MRTQTFGIELETYGPGRERTAKAIAAYFGMTVIHRGRHLDDWRVPMPDRRYWTVERDGSVTDPSAEVVSPVCRWEDIPMVLEIAKAIRAAGARTDSSCGIHVHVGLGEHTPASLRRLINIVNANRVPVGAESPGVGYGVPFQLPLALLVIRNSQQQANICGLQQIDHGNLIIAQMQADALAFLETICFAELLGRHAEHDAEEHVALVGVMVRLRLQVKPANLYGQLRVLFTRRNQRADEMLHFVEAFDIEFLEPGGFFAGKAMTRAVNPSRVIA